MVTRQATIRSGRAIVLASCALLLCSTANAQPSGRVAGWPAEVQTVRYVSAADRTEQPALFYDPDAKSSGENKPSEGDAGRGEARPLLVALHSWSGDYTQANPAYALWCIQKKWVMIHPNFRGINQHPDACGSEKAVLDIASAVEYAKRRCRIDADRIYLIGASGGGYASLLMAGRTPEIWAGVSAWCPIYDLRAWHAETRERKLKYADMLEKVCGGSPGESAEIDEQYRVRSAAAWLQKARGVNLEISTGITDGHNGSVPIGHTLRAFNAVADEPDRIDESIIARMQSQPSMPPDLAQAIHDPLFRSKPALYRRISHNAMVTIFQGGHDIVYEAGLAWLEQQRRGKPPVWIVAELPNVDLSKVDAASGK